MVQRSVLSQMIQRSVLSQMMIAQQLPDLSKLQKLRAAVTASNHTDTTKKETAETGASKDELNEYLRELKESIEELHSTPYASELYLLILPILIEIKKNEHF